jgi:DMSO/TMAO reductase YedYZ molybdopterin-dependent catalytic subunit
VKQSTEERAADDRPPDDRGALDRAGTPVGRRAILGLAALGVAGVFGGHWAQDGLAALLRPVEQHDPTGLTSLIPLGNTFRYYSVTGSVPRPTRATYRLSISGLVARPVSYSLAALEGLPQTTLVRDFQCVTGWHVPEVHWGGVPLSILLDAARPSADADAVRFHSFDGTYTESLPLAAARRSDVLVALQMLGGPVSHDHGGPVRIYAAEMYGYKSTKWLSGIELTHGEVPGYWETRGYDINGFIDR